MMNHPPRKLGKSTGSAPTSVSFRSDNSTTVWRTIALCIVEGRLDLQKRRWPFGMTGYCIQEATPTVEASLYSTSILLNYYSGKTWKLEFTCKWTTFNYVKRDWSTRISVRRRFTNVLQEEKRKKLTHHLNLKRLGKQHKSRQSCAENAAVDLTEDMEEG